MSDCILQFDNTHTNGRQSRHTAHQLQLAIHYRTSTIQNYLVQMYSVS